MMKWYDLRIIINFGWFCFSLICFAQDKNQVFTSQGDTCYNIANELQLRGFFDSSIVYYRKAANIYQQEGKKEAYLLCNIALSHCYLSKKKQDSVRLYYDRLKLYAPENKHYSAGLRAQYIHLKCKYPLCKNKFTGVLHDLDIAKELAEEQHDSILLASNYFYRAQYYFNHNEESKALEHYKKALYIHEKLNIKNINTALYHEYIAYIYYSSKRKTEMALKHIDYSLQIQKQIKAHVSEYLWNLYAKALILKNEARNYEAIDILMEAERLINQNDNNNNNNIKDFEYYQFHFINEIGLNYQKLDKHEIALSYFNKALDIANIQDNNEHRAIAYHNIGFSNQDMKKYHLALDYYFRSVFINEAMGEENLYDQYLQIANVYKELKDYSNAERFYLMSIDHAQKAYRKMNQYMFFYYHDYGKFLLQLGRYDEAKELLLKLYDLSGTYWGEDHYYTSRSYLRLGDYYKAIGDVPGALKYYHNAIHVFFNGFDMNDYFALPNENNLPPYEYVAECLGKKAGVLVLMGKKKRDRKVKSEYFRAAMGNYLLALKVINKLKYEYKDLDFGYLLGEDFKYIFEEGARSALEAYNQTKEYYYLNCAWEFSESNKAALIKAMYTNNMARELTNIPIEIQERENNIRDDISMYWRLINSENEKHVPDNEKITKWNRMLLYNYSLLDSLTDMLQKNNPQYFDLKYNTEVVDIKTLQSNIKEDQVVVEYFLSQDNLITFAITKDHANAIQQTIDSSFYKMIEQFSHCFRGGVQLYSSLEDFRNYSATAYSLYIVLLFPIEQYIANRSITVIPDDILSVIPFEALLYKPTTSQHVDYKGAAYVIKRNPIHYEYAASFIGQFPNKKAIKNPKILAIVPSYDSLYMKRILDLENKIQKGDKNYLIPLAGACDEVNEISKIYWTKKLLGEKASEEKFRALAHKYNILHIAGHTYIDDEQPMYSKLLFTMNRDSTEDDMLNTFELYNLHLGCSMVVLSGCNTGFGKLRKGEGMVSLARGFIYAGCNSIIMTLWSVSDKSSAELMAEFYNELAKGHTKDEALRKAKLNYLQKADPLKAHPYYWAGYICIGDSVPLPRHAKGFLIILYIVGSIVLLLSILYVRKRRKKTV